MLLLMAWAWMRIAAWFARRFQRRNGRRGRHSTPPVYCRTRAKPLWVTREIVRLKALMPDAGCRVIALVFNRRYTRHADSKQRMTVGKSFVAETLRRHRYKIEAMRRRMKHRVPRAMPRNLVWAMDLTGKTDSTGNLHMILGLLDHGSRGLLALDALPNKTSWTLLGHLFLAMGKYGKPRAVRTDNEACFVSRVFRAALVMAGIRHQRSDPGCPWQNGRVERLFGTLKNKLDRREVESFATLNAALGEFRLWYNHVRPHQHLQGRTPAEAWAGVNPFAAKIRGEYWFEAWGGLLQGYYLRR
ncbi:MAG: integrase core domain-containing protein [Candidatus Thermoplasmatota archaeon]|nr:integrase core domain-containing protein [Candidatus Thermoplasmatota archaeon]